jgi:hypothetical protein
LRRDLTGSMRFVHQLTALQRNADKSTQLPAATQLSVVILDVSASLEVTQSGVFHFAIFLLAARLECVAAHLDVLAGLGVGAVRAILSIPIISVLVAIMVVSVLMVTAAICVAVVAIPPVAIAAIAAIVPVISIVAVAIISAGALEVSV